MKDIFTLRFNEMLNTLSVNQTKLAEKLGVNKQNITEYKSGRAFPSLLVFRNICKELDVSADYLLGLED